jgi:RimJ/RimL family protein N-acetyltransferase
MSLEDLRSDFFPFAPAPDYQVRAVDEATFWEVSGELTAEVFTPLPDLGLATFRPPPEAVAQAWNVHRDFFVFYDGDDKPIGWSFSEQREPDTIFMVWTGIVPAHQNQGLYSKFLHHYLDYARAMGFARVTSNHMVNNRRVLVAKLKAGFVAQGMALDERWGAMIWLVCHLDDELAASYRRAFSLETYPD